MIIQHQTAIYVEQVRILKSAIESTLCQLNLNEHNKQAYGALINDLCTQKHGLVSFVFRVSDGNIVDYVKMDNIPPEFPIDEPESAQIPS